VVVAADAVVDPDAVVVLALNAGAAEGAVLGARGFGVVAGGAEVAWVEEEVVVGVGCQGGVVGWVERDGGVLLVVDGGDGDGGGCAGAEVESVVGEKDGWGDEEFVN
jgi:hypothetical protein